MLELNKVYLCDCLKFMKDLKDDSVDLIIADPPYNIGKDKGDNWDTIENYIELFEQWIIEWKRILKEDGLLYCYCSQLFQADIEMIFRKHMNIQNRIIWCYNNGQRQATKRLPFGYEPLFMISKSEDFNFKPIRDPNNIQQGVRTKKNPSGSITITQPNPDGVKFTDVWNVPKLSGGAKRTKHPTEKPLELGNRMLRSLSDLKLVYMPFGGSGTEIVNCIENGINYIATEISEKYINDIILPRINDMS
jgi:site-specific DNA-methyltransferase (adenine-specific)